MNKLNFAMKPEAIPFVILQFVLMIAAFISLARKPVPTKSKLPWLPLLFVNIVGPIIYFAIGSGKLSRLANQPREANDCD